MDLVEIRKKAKSRKPGKKKTAAKSKKPASAPVENEDTHPPLTEEAEQTGSRCGSKLPDGFLPSIDQRLTAFTMTALIAVQESRDHTQNRKRLFIPTRPVDVDL